MTDLIDTVPETLITLFSWKEHISRWKQWTLFLVLLLIAPFILYAKMQLHLCLILMYFAHIGDKVILHAPNVKNQWAGLVKQELS